jgi:hypothetical protein
LECRLRSYVTAPLLQNWLSNAYVGTRSLFPLCDQCRQLLALLLSIWLGPKYGVTAQSRLWLDGYGLLLTMFAFSSVLIWKESRFTKRRSRRHGRVRQRAILKTRLHWVAAAFVPSALMLVTNHISLNIGSVPFLWVIPLAVYLLTLHHGVARRIQFRRKSFPPSPHWFCWCCFRYAGLSLSMPARSSS